MSWKKQDENIPSGGKPRQRLWALNKKCHFRHSETIDSFLKIGLKSPGIGSAFLMMSCILQGICSWKRARCFPLLSHRHGLLQRATIDLQKVFWFGVHPTPLPHPDVPNQFWVHMAVDSGRKTIWYGWFMKHSTLIVWKANHNMKLSVDRLQGLVPVLHLYQHLCESYNYDASKGKPRRDVACACDAS